MQTPAPRITPIPTSHHFAQDAPSEAGDRTVRLTTSAIRRAPAAPPTRAPLAAAYRPQPVPPQPVPPQSNRPPSYRPSSFPSQPYPPAPMGAPATAAALADAHSGPDGADGTGAGGDTADAPTFSLTATQVAASMSAAVVAAFIGAQLGVAGTIVGAAIASLVSVVGSAVIGHSLLLTRRKVTQTVHHVRVGAGSPADAVDTVLLTAVTRRDGIERAAPARPGPTGASARRGWWSRPGRLRWVLVGLVASAAVFAAALGAVTIVEAVKGAPISGGESGFSVLGGNRGTGPQDAPSSSTRTTVTETTTAPPTTTSSSAPATSSPATSSSPTPSATASTAASALPPATSPPPTSAPATRAPTTAATTRAPVAGTGAAAARPAG